MTWTASQLGLTSHQNDEWSTGAYEHEDVKFTDKELELVDLAAAWDGLTRAEFVHNAAMEKVTECSRN